MSEEARRPVWKRPAYTWLLYLLLASAAAVAYLFLPGALQNITYNLIGVSMLAAILLGIRWHRPSPAWPWYLIAFGLSLFVAGDTVFFVIYENVLGMLAPFPSIADALYLSSYAITAVGLVFLVRPATGRGWGNLLDVVIVTVGIGLVSWEFLMEPYVEDQSILLLPTLVSIAYPIMALLWLALALRIVFVSALRPLSFYLLLVGIALHPIADTVYGVLTLQDAYQSGTVLDLGWLLSYAFFGATALHPSMREMSARVYSYQTRVPWWRLALLTVAALSAPAIFWIHTAQGDEVHAPLIGGALVLLSVVMVRMALLLRNNERVTEEIHRLNETLEQRVEERTAELERALAEFRRSEARHRAVMETAPDAIITMTCDGLIHSFNSGAEEIFGYAAEEVTGKPLTTLMPDRFRVSHEKGLRRYLETDEAHIIGRTSVELMGLRKDGEEFPLELSLGETRKEERLFTGIIRDITKRKEAESKLKRSEERYRTIVDTANEGVWSLDARSKTTFVNQRMADMLGYAQEEMLGRSLFDFVDDAAYEEAQRYLKRRQQGIRENHDFRFRHKDGSDLWAIVSASPLLDENGEYLGAMGMITDITERKRMEEQLNHQAFHDPLTDLPNRQLLVDRLGQSLGRPRRRRGRTAAVLFLDLDNFKVINDSLGHDTGDRLLVAVAERLQGCLRPEDTLARFGGDEFIVLIEDVESPADTVRVADRIVETLREPFAVDGTELFVGTSIGIAIGTARSNSPEGLLKDADTAMYTAKQERSGYMIFDPAMYERAVRRLELENELRRAVATEEFVIHYQPIVNLQSSEVQRVEALVRWEHPERGLLNPSEFMAMSEESGLIVPLGEGVLEEASRQAKEWHEEHPLIPPLAMSVNLSARQLRDPNLAKTVEKVLRKTGLEPRCLVLEITETVYIKILEGNIVALDDLKRLGVRISIDDFGIGYSSLAYLKRLPADVLKIDKSFLKGIGENVEDTAIVGLVTDLAHTLGMEVVAEGVESEEQAAQLREMGCDFAQGFYFSEGLLPEAASKFLIR